MKTPNWMKQDQKNLAEEVAGLLWGIAALGAMFFFLTFMGAFQS